MEIALLNIQWRSLLGGWYLITAFLEIFPMLPF